MNGIKNTFAFGVFLLNCNVNDKENDRYISDSFLLGYMFGGMFSACMPSANDIEPVRKVD